MSFFSFFCVFSVSIFDTEKTLNSFLVSKSNIVVSFFNTEMAIKSSKGRGWLPIF